MSLPEGGVFRRIRTFALPSLFFIVLRTGELHSAPGFTTGFGADTAIRESSPNIAARGAETEPRLSGLLWRYVAGGSFRGKPVPGPDGSAYALAEDRYLHAIDRSGKPIWKYDMSGKVSDLVGRGPDGTIVAATERGIVHAVNPAGYRIWTFDAGTKPVTAPAFDAGGTIYFGTSDGVLSAVSHTGRLRWRYQAPGGISAGPVVNEDGVIYLASERGVLYALTPWGDTVWSVSTGDVPVSILPGIPVAVGMRSGGIRTYGKDGTEGWKIETGMPAGFFSSAGNGRIVFISSGGKGKLLNRDGSLSGMFDVPVPVSSGSDIVCAPDGTVFVPGVSGGLFTARTGSGTVSVSFETGSRDDGDGRTGRSSLSPDGVLFTGWDDWVLSAYDTSASGPATSFGSYRGEFTSDRPDKKILSDYGYLKVFAESDLAELKEIALSDIEKRYGTRNMMDSGGYLKSVLRHLADEAVFGTVIRNRVVVNNYPDIRMRALALLTETADLKDLGYFTRLLEYEYDPLVRMMLIRSLGEIGSDPEGTSTAMLNGMFESSSAGKPDDRTVSAIVDSLEKIFVYHGRIANVHFRETLNRIVSGDFSRAVREKALILLNRTRDNYR